MNLSRSHFTIDPDNEDYIPVVEELVFTVVTGNRQCINISLIDDMVLENDEMFFIQAISTGLVTPTRSSVNITILNDDGKTNVHSI